MSELSLGAILLSIVTSVFAGILVAYYLRYRERKVRKQIEELASYEIYLEKLSKGNIKLLRSSLALIFISLFLLSGAALVVLFGVALGPGPKAMTVIIGIAGTALSIVAALCFYQVRAIIHSADLPTSRQRLKIMRAKLESRIT